MHKEGPSNYLFIIFSPIRTFHIKKPGAYGSFELLKSTSPLSQNRWLMRNIYDRISVFRGINFVLIVFLPDTYM